MSPEPLQHDAQGRVESRRALKLQPGESGERDHRDAQGTPAHEPGGGRIIASRSLRLDGSELAWSHVRQSDAAGGLIFEFATDFVLDGCPIDDRRGERFLDHAAHRVDGTRIIR